MNAPSEPRLLLIEASGRVGQLGLAEGPRLREHRRLDAQRRHARDLAPAVKEMLAAAGWKPRGIHAVAVSRGPGSYTGLRVGIMSAKAFAYAAGCAILGIETFAALALQVETAGRMEVIADAQQNKIYAQTFLREANRLPTAKSPLAIHVFSTWISGLSADSIVTGPGLRVYGNALKSGPRLAAEKDWDPTPESMLKIGLERWRAGERDDVWKMEPIYLRPSAAEEQLARR